MSKLTKTILQPQILSIFVVTLILIIFTIFIYQKIKKHNIKKAPKGILLFVEQYVMSVDNLFEEVTDGEISKPAPYIFSLITFLFVSNTIGIFGLETPSSSYSVTLTLAFISWIGIYVVGIVYQKFSFFRRYLNPTNFISQFAPLISLSFRMFGNIIGGSTIIYLLYYFTGWVWSHIPIIGHLNLLGIIIAPMFHMYFDIFSGLIQGFVFTLLTMIYWTLQTKPPRKKQNQKNIFKKHFKKGKLWMKK